MHLASILLPALGVAYAAPQGHPHAMYVEGMSPGSAVDDHQEAPVGLPGFDRLLRNKTAAAAAAATIGPSAGDAFGGKCMQVTLGGHGKIGQTMLEGRCVDGSGQWWETSLNLNQCIGNEAGKLVYNYSGNFDGSCRPCIVDKAADRHDLLLKCNCLDARRIPKYTYLEMGSYVQDSRAIKPVDGRFICGTCMGIKSPSL